MKTLVKNYNEIELNSEIANSLWVGNTMECEFIKKANDWITVWKEGGRYQKYAMLKYSPSLQMLRHTTMDEFYGNGIVD